MGLSQRPFLLLIITSLVLFSPHLLRSRPGPYTTPLADALAWLGDIVKQALVCFAFFLAVALAFFIALDVYRWLNGTAASTSTSAPLAGTPTPALGHPAAHATDIDGPTPSGTIGSMLAARIILLFATSGLIALHFFAPSSPISLMECMAVSSLYTLRLGGVLFLAACVDSVGAWVRKRYAAPEADAEGEILLESGLLEEETFVEKA
ncbi:hypothetical protein B0H12DRAFT_1143305 [Mycena haematopus]|nr:hypothetical protein B0H12DRAFT_1143305 [Mycena haematopus]